MHIIKSSLAFSISAMISAMTFAAEHEHMSMPETAQEDHSTHQNMPIMTGHEDHSQHHNMPMETPQEDHSNHDSISAINEAHASSHNVEHSDHKNEHGGQIYTAVRLDQRWRSSADGDAEFISDNELRIGTDEHKLIAQLEAEKAESQSAEYDTKLLYSHMLSDFWDVQAGLGYQRHNIEVNDQEKKQSHVNAVFGIQGLAPYFFETSAYLSVAKDDYMTLNFDAERDFLITQKLITQPYIELDAILHDGSKYAEKSGIREASIGFQTRYEVSKQFMPYVDIAYRYEQETQWQNTQQSSDHEKDWVYGVGVKFNF